MDLFDYMRETAKETESPLASPSAPEDAGGGSRPAAHYWERQIVIPRN